MTRKLVTKADPAKRRREAGKIFMRRTYSIYRDMAKRAASIGRLPDFILDDLRAMVELKLGFNPLCPYCRKGMSHRTWSLDHKVPVSRGGSFDKDNSQIICSSCNKSKGNLTDAEYGVLLRKLDEAEKETRNFEIGAKVLTALRISASFRFGADRRARRTR
jgi:5-methylcytosine-specific restriction endonuclease McrA